ncbi:MAG: cysteine peptidase family C39 domain-containing protein [Pseudomonadota bacterium]
MPAYRSPGDCGRMSLYVWLRLLGCDVTVDDVNSRVEIGPNGSSIEQLHKVSEELQIRGVVRFVKPSELRRVRKPFILHGDAGIAAEHGFFTVIVAYDPLKGFAVVDPTNEFLGWFEEGRMASQASGYVLAPRGSNYHEVASIAGLVLSGSVFVWVLSGLRLPAG